MIQRIQEKDRTTRNKQGNSCRINTDNGGRNDLNQPTDIKKYST